MLLHAFPPLTATIRRKNNMNDSRNMGRWIATSEANDMGDRKGVGGHGGRTTRGANMLRRDYYWIEINCSFFSGSAKTYFWSKEYLLTNKIVLTKKLLHSGF